MDDKLQAIETFFDEESLKAERERERLGDKITMIVISRVLKRVKRELCDTNKECFLALMDLWMTIEESEESTKH